MRSLAMRTNQRTNTAAIFLVLLAACGGGTFTILQVAADEFATEIPIPIAIIETDNGGRLTAQVVDCAPDEVTIGKRVKLVFRRIQSEGHAGIHQYGYKAVLER